jgi:hypothetical protein
MNAPKVRMDRGRDHATVHGERGPGDPHAAVHFYQDGLPFDAQGFLIADHVDLQGDDPKSKALRELANRKLKKASERRAVEATTEAPSGTGDDGDDGQNEGDDGNNDKSVNLEAWLRGEEDYMWHLVTQAIAARFKRRVQNLPDAVTFLVQEKVAPANQVAKKFQKHLETV